MRKDGSAGAVGCVCACVLTMSCNPRDELGFVFIIFENAGRAISITYCFLGRESHILIVYVSIMFLFCLVCLKIIEISSFL